MSNFSEEQPANGRISPGTRIDMVKTEFGCEALCTGKQSSQQITMSDSEKKLALKMVALLVLISHWPAVIGRVFFVKSGVSTSNILLFLVLPCIQLALMLTCVVYAVARKDNVSGFDTTWIRASWSELIFFLLFPLAVFVTDIFVGLISKIFGLTPIAVVTGGMKPWLVVATSIEGILGVPLVEELFWRGYVQWNLRKVLRPWIALVVQAILFAMLHVGGIRLCLSAFGRAMVFGLWREKRRTLLPIILVHAVVNILYYARIWYLA